MKKVILKLTDSVNIQSSNEGVRLNKISSAISPSNFIKLLHYADNKVNPRDAKINKITKSINETLEVSPELFFFKSKGILVATMNCRSLDRNRVEMTFDDVDYEGIMDGGHNALAIANFLIGVLMDQKVKTWEECKEFWDTNYDEIVEKFQQREQAFRFSIPLEIISPNNEEGAIDDYYDHLKEICSARNNNVQLTEVAKGNQSGYYDYLKEILGDDFSIIWKSGEPGKTRSEDVISLATIPLMFLAKNNLLPKGIKSLNKTSIYSQKGKCVDFFNEVMEDKELISGVDKGRSYLKSKVVKSALEMTKDILPFFDRLYLNFPNMYNGNGGSFGRITSVVNKESKVPFFTTDEHCAYQYPAGFLYPLAYGLISLMEYDEANETVNWKVNPEDISIDDIEMTQYVNIIKLAAYDPQKVGKNETFYNQAEEMFKKLEAVE
jgi:hypothetical protein